MKLIIPLGLAAHTKKAIQRVALAFQTPPEGVSRARRAERLMLIIPAGQVTQLQDGNIVSRAGIHHSPKGITMTNVQYLSQQYTFQQSKLFSLKKRVFKSQLNNYCPLD